MSDAAQRLDREDELMAVRLLDAGIPSHVVVMLRSGMRTLYREIPEPVRPRLPEIRRTVLRRVLAQCVAGMQDELSRPEERVDYRRACRAAAALRDELAALHTVSPRPDESLGVARR